MRHFALGIVLIALASGVLLMSDWQQRKASGGAVKRIAIMQHASQAALDESVDGMIASLAARGFVDGRNISIKRFNAENDLGTANAIARQVTTGEFDLVITSSTISLQSVASANRDGKVTHVFGAVADPYAAGVGITRDSHPKHLTGRGTRISVERAVAQAREFNPQLKKLGIVWNPAESNSQRYTADTREACKKFGIELLEANAENSTAVSDAANSVVSRGAEALIITGDVMVLVAAESVAAAAKRGRIPAFSIIPPTVKRGMLFDLGANFFEVGKEVGDIAADVLNGADPASIPVKDTVPEKLAVNTTVLTGLRDKWTVPDAVIQRAALVVDANGVRDRSANDASASTRDASSSTRDASLLAATVRERFPNTKWVSSTSRPKKGPTSAFAASSMDSRPQVSKSPKISRCGGLTHRARSRTSPRSCRTTTTRMWMSS